MLDGFAARLRREEKSRATAKKYLHDAAAFAAFAAGREITKELTAAEYERLLAAAGDSRRCSARARCVSSFCPAPSAAFCGGI